MLKNLVSLLEKVDEEATQQPVEVVADGGASSTQGSVAPIATPLGAAAAAVVSSSGVAVSAPAALAGGIATNPLTPGGTVAPPTNAGASASAATPVYTQHVLADGDVALVGADGYLLSAEEVAGRLPRAAVAVVPGVSPVPSAAGSDGAVEEPVPLVGLPPAESLTGGASAAVAAWAARLARSEAQCERLTREAARAEEELGKARGQLATAERLLQSAGAPANAAPPAPTDEAESFLEDRRAEAVARLERVTAFHVLTIATLERSNEALRRSLLDAEGAHALQVDELQAELSRAPAVDMEAYAAAVRDRDRRKDENGRLLAKTHSLSEGMRELQATHSSLRAQHDQAMAMLAKREAELEELRSNAEGSQRQDVQGSRLFQAISEQSPLGARVTRVAAAFDVASLQVGRLLRSNAPLRVFICLYVLILHLYMFHIVTSVVHVMPHVGVDVHDHLANHIHHQ